MSDWKFEYGDFVHRDFANGSFYSAQSIADVANAKLKGWLSKAQEVWICESKSKTERRTIDGIRCSDTTHKAKLIMIEELPKKECEHEPLTSYESGVLYPVTYCRFCGVTMKAKWEVEG